MERASFAAGCFWGVEDKFRKLPGVVSTEVGYTGGRTENPSYEEVCQNNTGHTEAVRLEFDPKKISYDDLLRHFWKIHDPTQVNRQGPDIGEQYRSVIFYHTDEQKEMAEKSLLEEQEKRAMKIATQIQPAVQFYRAEEYHQLYLQKRGQGSCDS